MRLYAETPIVPSILVGPKKKGKVRAQNVRLVCGIRIAAKKKPHGVSGGAGFLFFSKEVTEFNNRCRDTFLLLLDSDLLVFVVIFLLASKSFSHRLCYRLQLHFAWAEL